MKIEPGMEKDPFTGREIVRLTEPTSDAHAQYAFNCPFTSDLRYLVYPSRRTGLWEVWRADRCTHEHEKLSQGVEVGSFSVHTCQATDETFYATADGRQIWRVHATRGAPELLLEIAGGRITSVPVPNPEGTHLSWVRQAGNDYFAELMPLATKKPEVIHSSAGVQFDHPCIRPGDPETVLLCRYGRFGSLRNQRMWLWRRAWGQARPINPQPNWSMVGHEVWMPDGREVVSFRYYRYDRSGEASTGGCWPKGIDPNHPELAIGISFFDVQEGREARWFKADCWHPCPSGDGRVVVMDGSYPPQAITKMDPLTGGTEVACTARINRPPDNNQLSHPHPSPSPDGRWVAYTSNHEGCSAVYVAPL
ncbi:MAG: PD40 domain-containing protein [Planctomycetes bacterium]|nr:PD40 domain-containing protein [Planctomycetota bacterium]